jgi:MFS family permease
MYDILSTLGNGIFSLFVLLNVHMIYGNALYTGIASFLMSAPRVFAFVVGPTVDRSKKVRIVRITTLLECGAMALLSFTPLLENVGVLFMFAVILVMSVAAMFENPAATALLPHIVKEDDILPANQLINIASAAGGILLAILLLAVLGQGENTQLIYGLSTGFVGAAFLVSLFIREVNIKTEAVGKTTHMFRADIIAGTKFLRNNVLRFILFANIALGFVAQIAYVSRPAFIEYHAGAQAYILIFVIGMVGSIFASMVVGPLGKRLKVSQIFLILFLFAGAGRIFFALVLPLSFIAALGITIVIAIALDATSLIIHTLQQKIPPKDMVGRVATMSTSFSAVSIAIGALAGAFIGRAVADVQYIFIAQGVFMSLIAFYYIFVPAIRKLPKFSDLAREGNVSDEDANDVG